MRPNRKCWDRDLPPDAEGAFICSFECILFADCADKKFGGAFPNCGRAIMARPTRAPMLLARFPAAAERKHRPVVCHTPH
jgi:hypothetical protein